MFSALVVVGAKLLCFFGCFLKKLQIIIIKFLNT
uniref:GM02640p n=1 Tax=Drosophila melanogaster TaxID=7227 RepID=Q95SD4_DROME|nr:GM02640p [Drosophila melanogaster]